MSLLGLHKCLDERAYPHMPMHTHTEDGFIYKGSHLSQKAHRNLETHGNSSTVVISSVGMTGPLCFFFCSYIF